MMNLSDLKNVLGMTEVVTADPTSAVLSTYGQVKICVKPNETVTGNATFGLVDEVYLRDTPYYGSYITDSSWVFNVTGQSFTSTATSAMPPPLVSGTTYYIIRISTYICKVAASYADAIAGTAIHITSSETGIWYITPTGYPENPVPELFVYDYKNRAQLKLTLT